MLTSLSLGMAVLSAFGIGGQDRGAEFDQLLKSADGISSAAERIKTVRAAADLARTARMHDRLAAACRLLAKAYGASKDLEKAVASWQEAIRSSAQINDLAAARADLVDELSMILDSKMKIKPRAMRILLGQVERYDRLLPSPILSMRQLANLHVGDANQGLLTSAQYHLMRLAQLGGEDAGKAVMTAVNIAFDRRDSIARHWFSQPYVLEKLKATPGHAASFTYLCGLYGYAGDVDGTKRFGRMATTTSADRKAFEPSVLNNTGQALRESGRLTEAEGYYKRSLVGRKGRNRLEPLRNLTSLMLDMGRWREARAYADECLKLLDSDGEESTDRLLSLLERALADHGLGRKGALDSIMSKYGQTIVRLAVPQVPSWARLVGLAVHDYFKGPDSWDVLNDWENATEIMSFIDVQTSGAADLSLTRLKWLYLGLYLRDGEGQGAFHSIDMMKARNLVFDEVGRGALRPDASALERQCDEVLRTELEQANLAYLSSIQSGDPRVTYEASLRVRAASEERSQFLTESGVRRGGLNLNSLDRLVDVEGRLKQALGTDTAFVSYGTCLTRSGLSMAAVVVRPGHKTRVVGVGGKKPMPLNEIESQVEVLSSQYGGGQFTRSVVPTLKSVQNKGSNVIADALLDPILPLVQGAKHLVICPDGTLSQVSFGSLRAGNVLLGQRFAITYAFSAATLLAEIESGAKRPLTKDSAGLVVANPDFSAYRSAAQTTLGDLPGTTEEAGRICAAFPRSVSFVGPEASEEAVRSRMPNASFIHFGSHGVSNSLDAASCFLVLSLKPRGLGLEGILSAAEIGAMKLKASLAVLSACSTGVGGYLEGEGTISLSHAFARAGVPSIVATLWPVDDRATAMFMDRFYEALARGSSKLDAFQAGLRVLQGDPKYFHPRFWGAYQLIGDWH